MTTTGCHTAETIVVSGRTTAQPSILRRLDVAAVRFFDTLASWQDRRSQRRHLSQMDDHLLHDVGLSRADVDHEISKPFWQI